MAIRGEDVKSELEVIDRLAYIQKEDNVQIKLLRAITKGAGLIAKLLIDIRGNQTKIMRERYGMNLKTQNEDGRYIGDNKKEN